MFGINSVLTIEVPGRRLSEEPLFCAPFSRSCAFDRFYTWGTSKNQHDYLDEERGLVSHLVKIRNIAITFVIGYFNICYGASFLI